MKDQGTPTILAVDSEPFVLKSLERYLEAEGYEVFLAATKERADEILSKTAVDVVLLGLSLPDAAGLDLCRGIKSNEKTRGIEVLLLTGPEGDLSGGASPLGTPVLGGSRAMRARPGSRSSNLGEAASEPAAGRHGDGEEWLLGFEAGAAGYIPKPFSRSAVLQSIARLLEGEDDGSSVAKSAGTTGGAFLKD